MTDELVPTFVPPLLNLLINAERQKGAPLTEEEVIAVRDRGVCIMLPSAEAAKIKQSHGQDDIDPDCVWEQWQAVRKRLTAPKPAERKTGRFRFVAEEMSLEDMPNDQKERAEAFVEIFGRQLLSLRNEALEVVRSHVDATQVQRDRLGKIRTQECTAVAKLPKHAQEAAHDLSRKAVDLFLQNILTLFTYNGLSTEISLGGRHALSYEIFLKVLQKDTLDAVEQHCVNKDCQKVFGDYYGRWLNRHGDA